MLTTSFLSISLLLAAQPAPPPTAQPSPMAVAAGTLGQRVLAHRVSTTTAPIVVLVPDEGSYLAAIKLWGETGQRFPVLIDDTSLPGRQDIARFVRAFKPASVVRLTGEKMPEKIEDREKLILDTLHATWKATRAEEYAIKLKARPVPEGMPTGPLGIVVTSVSDSAWPAAVALAAAHGQVLMFASPPASGTGTMSMAEFDKLQLAVANGCSDRGLKFSTLGDDIDMVTICLNIPVKVTVGASDAPQGKVPQLVAKPGEALSTTDLMGRMPTGARNDRWAWCGQVIGTTRQSAYRAMSAIFLKPESAFLFDGYENSGDWNAYDCTKAGKMLSQAGLRVDVIDAPDASSDNWRLSTVGALTSAQRRGNKLPAPGNRGGLNAGFVCVNTMGNHDFFQLRPGNARAGDVPLLDVPTMVHFVHSWSLTLGGDPWAVGGRWIDHGAYAYVGSVHEPFLNAFVPTPDFCGRMLGGLPLGVSARVHEGPFQLPWRVAVLGDPLITLGPAARVSDRSPTLVGAKDLADELPALVKSRNYALALDTLEMLNRGTDAARLAAAAISQDADNVGSEAALRGVLSAYFAGDSETVAAMGAKIELPGDRDYQVADAIWQALWPRLETLNADQAKLLSRTLRPYNYAQDAVLAAKALARTQNAGAASAFYQNAKDKAPRADIKKDMIELEKTLPRP